MAIPRATFYRTRARSSCSGVELAKGYRSTSQLHRLHSARLGTRDEYSLHSMIQINDTPLSDGMIYVS